MDITRINPGTIVVGVNGSDSADQALIWAAEQASLERRPLTVVHAFRPLTTSEAAWLESAGVHREEVADGQRVQGRRILAAATARVARKSPDVVVEQLLVGADARQVLLDNSADAALVVVGSRGRGPVTSLLLGSVSVSVSGHAACPVVVVRPHHPGVVRRGVLVGTDATGRSRTTLEFAYRAASLRGLPLTVLHCYWDAQSALAGFGTVPDDFPGMDEQRLALAETLSGMTEKFPDVQVRTQLARGLAEQGLIDTAETMDLVVVGHHGSSSPNVRGAGSMAGAVIEHASTVVAVVPDRPLR